MKKTLLLASFATFFFFLFANFSSYHLQNNPSEEETIFYDIEGNNQWLKVKENVHFSAEELARTQKSQLGLGQHDELINYRTQTDDLGITHYRYYQYHRGVKVDGAIVLMHEKNGAVYLVNGKWVRNLDANIAASLNDEDAINAALGHFPADRYMWESEAAERMLKKVMSDPEATFYPQPEQVLIDPNLDQVANSYRIAYSLIMHTQSPLEQRKQLYIDANNGSILLELEMIHDSDTIGIAETKYNGTREIVTDSVGPGQFRLRETGRGGGIETYNKLNTSTNDVSGAVDFIDEDNYWNNFNEQQDEAATDAHFGAEMTFDYFHQKHGYVGVDGNSMPFISYVHHDENWVNAQWTGGWARFGDGNGSSFTALTALDVVAHEFAHGINQFSADLIYANEMGALNESFSDIFGTAVELWATPELGDWFIGEDFDLVNNGFRDMKNPKEDGDPDTYKGQFWATGTGDNGGVHTNSGVQNRWFYLLTEGDTGTNDNGDEYNVQGLGLDTAANIAFRNLQHYLAERSQYIDARLGAIQSAEDIYGPCSDVVQEVMRAWYAVGVGREHTDFDMRMLEIISPGPIECGLSAEATITVQLRYYGCNEDLQAGDKIPLAYQVNEGAIQWDTITLETALTGGDTLNFSFAVSSDELATSGAHSLKCWVAFDSDTVEENDALEMTVDNILDQNIDLSVVGLRHPLPGCYLSERPVEIEIGFFGCESLPANEPIEISFSVNGGPVSTESITTPFELDRGETFTYLMSDMADLSSLGRNYINAWVNYQPDYLTGNDTLVNFAVTNPFLIRNHTIIDFEGGDPLLDSIYWLTSRESSVRINEEAARDGDFGLQMTGGDVLTVIENEEIVPPDADNVWFVNQMFNSRFCFCLDLTDQIDASLRFERRQTNSRIYGDLFNEDLKYASPLRVLVNDQQISSTFKPTSFNLPLWFTRTLELNDFLGQQVEVCFEARALISPEYDPDGIGDNTFLDNIVIFSTAVATTEPISEISNFQIYPNPGKGLFTINYQADRSLDLQINVLDVYGRKLQTSQKASISGKNSIELDLERLSPGMYIVQLQDGERQLVQQIIVE